MAGVSAKAIFGSRRTLVAPRKRLPFIRETTLQYPMKKELLHVLFGCIKARYVFHPSIKKPEVLLGPNKYVRQ